MPRIRTTPRPQKITTGTEPAKRGQGSGLIPYKPGQSGNPAGRPVGSRQKLGESFIADVYADWKANGAAVIQKVRDERPADYFKVVASILPREINFKDVSLGDLTDEELGSILAAMRPLAHPVGDRAARARAGVAAPAEDTGETGRLN